MSAPYVHGYDAREARRLRDQAASLVELLHHDTTYPPASRVLEAGCGVGAQTVTLATGSPEAHFTSIDVSAASLALARQAVASVGATNVTFEQADLYALPYPEASFDHAFVCFVLEHLTRPVEALRQLQRVVKPGGTITVIEGDHGSTYFHPDDADARRVVQVLVDLQARGGGHANIGRELYPRLTEAGLDDVRVSPRMVYVDGSRPALVEGFTRNTFAAMVQGVRETAVAAGLIDGATFDRGISGLLRAAAPDGVFCYTFFKGVGVVTG